MKSDDSNEVAMQAQIGHLEEVAHAQSAQLEQMTGLLTQHAELLTQHADLLTKHAEQSRELKALVHASCGANTSSARSRKQSTNKDPVAGLRPLPGRHEGLLCIRYGWQSTNAD